MRRHARLAPALAVALALAAIAAAGGAAGAGTAAADRPAPPVRLTRADAWFGLGAVAAVGLAGLADHELRERARASDGDGARDLARAVRTLGAPEVLGPAVVLAWAAGRALDRPPLAAASGRIGASLLVAGIATGGLKLAVGRVRPDESAVESDPYRPFSGHGSFPSGHAALAFAAATALDRETEAAWLPWVAYPLAALVGWSRVRDDRHWTSDVVAGAALGLWTAAKTEDALRARAERRARLGMVIDAGGPGVRLGAGLQF